jgi:SAM-dependent methyltransferase
MRHPRPSRRFCRVVIHDEDVQHGWEDWTWDETLYQGAAPYYRRGRAPYAPGLAAALAEALPLDGRGRLLDVGCGPGIVALILADRFETVVGLDADAAMLDEARRAAHEQRIANATWVHMRAEDLPGQLGTFSVITFAQSFHWMARPQVATAVRTMIEPDGAVVQIDAYSLTFPPAADSGAHSEVPQEAIDELRVAFLGADRRAGQGFRNTSPSGEDAVFQAAGFLPEERVVVPDDRVIERSIDDVVAGVFSASSTAPHLFGDRLAEFEAALRALLAGSSPSGRFSQRLFENVLRIRRPASRRQVRRAPT